MNGQKDHFAHFSSQAKGSQWSLGMKKNMIVRFDVLSLGFVGGWFCYKKLHIFNPSLPPQRAHRNSHGQPRSRSGPSGEMPCGAWHGCKMRICRFHFVRDALLWDSVIAVWGDGWGDGRPCLNQNEGYRGCRKMGDFLILSVRCFLGHGTWDVFLLSCYSLFFPVVFWLYEGLPDVKLKG